MKKTVLLTILAFILCLLCGCTLTPVEQYNDFLVDLDIVMRIDMCLNQISEENPSWYTRADIKTIQQDLQTLRTDDENILAINDEFIGVAREMENSIALLDGGNPQAAQESYELAEESFEEAKSMLAQLPEGGPSV